MPIWTELSDIPLGTTIQTSLWNTLFGPDGNEAYLKQYADFVTYELEKVYYADNVEIRCGWPQGLSTDSRGYEIFYNTGDLVIPKWFVAGYPSNNYISLTGPAKYLAILNTQFWPYIPSTANLATFRIIVLDTSGEINIQKTIVVPDADITTGDLYFQYSFPIIIDAPFETDIMVGFIAQQRYDTDANLSEPIQFYIGDNTNISFYKLPVFVSSQTVSTSFILGSSGLIGSSSF